MTRTNDQSGFFPIPNRRKGIAVLSLFVVMVLVIGSVNAISRANAIEESERNLAHIQSKLNNSIVLPSDYKQVPSFSLQDSTGTNVTEQIFQDRWSLVFFGYTHCPDICPMTLSVVKEAIDSISIELAKQPQVMFITVDPVRDTTDHLNKYLAYFDPNFIGITGDVNRLSKWASSMGVMFERHDQNDKEHYSVDHSSSIFLIGPQGKIRALLNAPLDVNTIVSDYETILSSLDGYAS